MRWFILTCGWLATAATIAVSMRLNFLFGSGLGQSADKALLFGCISVVADAWKGLAPLLIFALLRDRRYVPATAASAVWLVCFLFAVSSALGIAIQDRVALTGGREVLQAAYQDVVSELERKQSKRINLSQQRSVSEVEAAIGLLLAKPVVTGDRVRGTVGSISAQCSRVDARTTETCSQVASLRLELAAAVEAARVDDEISALKQRVEQLRERGATLSADPQADLLSRITVGWIAPKDIGFGLIMLLAAVIELVSAFGPVILSAYAEVGRTRKYAVDLLQTTVATGRDVARPAVLYRDNDTVIEYMAERLAPANDADAIGGDEIFADYVTWCTGRKLRPLGGREFLDKFDRLRAEHDLETRIRKFGNRYFGIRLSSLALTN